jgi:cytochrome c556
MKRLLWLVLATCSIIATASVGAHEGATGIVAERMAAMKETAAQMKALDRALKAGSSVTPDMIASAEKIAAQAHSLSGLFPARSGGGHSEARAEVWTRREAFEKAMQAFAGLSGTVRRLHRNPASVQGSRQSVFGLPREIPDEGPLRPAVRTTAP